MTTKSSSNKTLGTYDRLNHVDPASISWHNIEVYSKPQKQYCFFKSDQKEVKLIKGVSGVVKQGKTLAIMGSSGAGKTTLLNVLTARNLSRVDVSGVVKINGQVADVKMITELTAYVQQVDLFIPLLTVREHLVFQAMVRMDRNIPLNVRAARINQVMEELSLVKCAETRVGGVGVFKGISGGEMKRLSFAVEILTNPAIMFCDEPTSGLDAFMAKKLVQKIRQMALAGRTIICTIHQPSSDVFNLFDNLLLLSDGRVAYMGKLSETIAYFNELGYKCPNNYNPADFFVNELAIEPGREFESRIKVNMICDFYLQKYCPKEKFHLQSSFLNTPNVAPYKASSWQQWKALTWRSGIVANRQPMLMYIRLFQATFISVMLGLVYFKQEYNNFGVININTALFLLSTNMIYQNALAVINTFSAELPIFIREHSSGQYGVAPYFFGKNLAELPVFVAVPILFVTIYYFLVGLTLDSFENFLFTLTVALFLSTLGVAFGYFMSCICGDADLGLAISPLLLMFFQLFGGFLVNNHKIPQYFRWAKDVSFYRYAFDLLMYNQWRNVSSLDCVPANDLAIIEKTTRIDANSSSSNGAAVPDQDRTMCFKDGLQIMDFYAVTRSSIFPYFGVLLLYNIGLRFAGYFALWVRSLARG